MSDSLLFRTVLCFERGGHGSSPLPWQAILPNVREIWNTECIRAVADEDLAPLLHEQRDGYHRLLVGGIKILEGYLQVFDVLPRTVNFYKQSDRFALFNAVKELKAHSHALFPRWDTMDDLEEILLEHIGKTLRPLHDDYFKASAPLQAWYDELDLPVCHEDVKA